MIQIDEHYSVKSDPHNWVLTFKKPLKKINPKTGKNVVQTDKWYCVSLERALNKYLDESLKTCKTVEEILKKIEEVKQIMREI